MLMTRGEAVVELRWFYTEREGELGLRGASLEPGIGGPETGDAAADRRTRSYARDCDVLRRLRGLDPYTERVLRLAFSPTPSHVWRGLERWYELAGVAALLTDQGDVMAAARAVARLKGPEAEALRASAKKSLEKALRAFVEVR